MLEDINILGRGQQVVVGTPGRVLDLITRKALGGLHEKILNPDLKPFRIVYLARNLIITYYLLSSNTILMPKLLKLFNFL